MDATHNGSTHSVSQHSDTLHAPTATPDHAALKGRPPAADADTPALDPHHTYFGWVAIMLAVLASMGGFIFGYDTGQISDILLLPDFRLRFATCSDPANAATCAFSVVREGLIVALLSVGTLAGALAGAPTADALGRRRAMSAECGLFIVGVVIQISSEHTWQQFAVGRFVSGLAVGALSAAVPMYQAEAAPAPLRGTLTATYQLFITLGILVAYGVSIGARAAPGSGSWRIIVGIGILWPLILGTGILFMPESPRWLAARDRMPEARAAIARTHGLPATHPVVRGVAEEIHSNAKATQGLKSGWAECFRWENKALYRTLLGMALQSLQQLTGANYFFYYGATVFQSVGISDSFVTQIILGAVNFVCTFGGLYVMERVSLVSSFPSPVPLLFFLRAMLTCITVRAPHAADHRRPLAVRLAVRLRGGGHREGSDDVPRDGQAHDRVRVHVHPRLRHDLGPVRPFSLPLLSIDAMVN